MSQVFEQIIEATALRNEIQPLLLGPNGITLFHSAAFGKDAIQKILDQDNCIGIRFYLAKYDVDVENLREHLTLIAIGFGNNEESISEQNSIAYKSTAPCPPYCPKGREPKL